MGILNKFYKFGLDSGLVSQLRRIELGKDRLNFVEDNQMYVFILKALKGIDLNNLNRPIFQLDMPFLISIVGHL